MTDEPLVTLGVPVYQGQDILPVTLECLRNQSYANLEILIAVDGADQASIDASRPFLDDPRFSLHVQPRRLGWAGNTDWTLRNRRGDFWIYQQHDDQVSPTYVADLVAAAARWPDAAVCYARMEISGAGREPTLGRHTPLLGVPLDRALTYAEQMDTTAFRGLIRGSALDATGGLRVGPQDSFASFLVLMVELALQGEFRFVEGPTYYKRMHGKNLHLRWVDWDEARKREAWASLAAGTAGAIVPAGATPVERWRLLFAVLKRFLAGRRGRWMFHEIDKTDAAARAELLAGIVDHVRVSADIDLPALLGAPWAKIEARLSQRLLGSTDPSAATADG